jgi:hypothetical protein
VNRLLAGIAGALGLRWLLKKRREAVEHDAATLPPPEAPEPEPEPEAEADPRAEELRARIEEAKAAGDDREEFEAGETPVDEVDPDARRSAVHEQARARIEEMARRERGGGGAVEDSTPADADD